MQKPINPIAFTIVLLRKFVEMGMLAEKKIAGKTHYFLTEQGRMILANFGIDEKDLYAERTKPK